MSQPVSPSMFHRLFGRSSGASKDDAAARSTTTTAAAVADTTTSSSKKKDEHTPSFFLRYGNPIERKKKERTYPKEESEDEKVAKATTTAANAPRDSVEDHLVVPATGTKKKKHRMPLRYPSAKHSDPEVDVLGDLTAMEVAGREAAVNDDDDDDDDDNCGGGGGRGSFDAVALHKSFDAPALPGGGATALGRTIAPPVPPPKPKVDPFASQKQAGSNKWAWALIGPGFPEMHDVDVAAGTAITMKAKKTTTTHPPAAFTFEGGFIDTLGKATTSRVEKNKNKATNVDPVDPSEPVFF